MADYRHPPLPCPACGYRLDAAVNVFGGRAPEDGDYSMCLACGALGIFTLSGKAIRAATKLEYERAWLDPEIVQAWQALQQAKALSRDWPTGPGPT